MLLVALLNPVSPYTSVPTLSRGVRLFGMAPSSRTWQDVDRKVAQLLEPHGITRCLSSCNFWSRQSVSLVPHHRPHRLGKMSKERLCSCLNLRRLHKWQSVPYSFVELRLPDVVVGLPRLLPPSSWTWQDIEREVAQPLELTERRLHTWQSVPYSFVELRCLDVVVGLPRLLPPSSWTWQDVEREVAQLLELTETPHVAVGPVPVLFSSNFRSW
jgi:hypothetical protein